MNEEQITCHAEIADADGYRDGTVCGKTGWLFIKYEAKFWPLSWGQMVLCEEHHEKIWKEIKRLWEV